MLIISKLILRNRMLRDSPLENELSELKSQISTLELKLEQLMKELASLKEIHLNCKDSTPESKEKKSRIIELEKQLNSINNLFQSSSDAIAALDNELYIKVMNESFGELFFHIIAIKVYVGMSLIRALADYPKLKSKIINACQKALAGQKTSLIFESTNNKEPYYCYELNISSLYNQYYQNNELVFRIRNLTEYKIQEKLERKQLADIALSSKTSAMGQMAAALAHEINQPLTAIIAYSRSCLFLINNHHNLPNDMQQKLLTPLEQIALQAEHAGEVINTMKDFMREGNCYKEETNINQLIQDALTILNYELLDFKLTINLQLADNLPLIQINRTHLIQVILNLARNSIEAFQGMHTDQPELTIETLQADGFITVHVRDNGPGIPLEYRNKILNTYFTTKKQGTGIGLGICRTFIEEHGGKLSVNEHTEGAWFTFTLPLNAEVINGTF